MGIFDSVHQHITMTVKKILISFAILLASMGITPKSSVAQTFDRGTAILSVGYGYGNFASAALSFYNNGFYTEAYNGSVGPFMVKGEIGIGKYLGLGINIAHLRINAEFTDEAFGYYYRFAYRNTSALLRINGHIIKDEHLDVYFGLGLGARIGGWELETNDDFADFDPFNFPIGLDATAGIRYLFTDFVGLYVEIGMAKGIVQGGLTFNLH